MVLELLELNDHHDLVVNVFVDIDFMEGGMAFPLVPIIIAALSGAIVTGTGIAVIDKRVRENKEVAETSKKLLGEAERLIGEGKLYPAFQAYQKFADYVMSNYKLSPEQKLAYKERYEELVDVAKEKHDKLKADYKKNIKEAEKEDSGAELYKVQAEHLAQLEKILGAGAPELKKTEDSFGINYQVQKYGVNYN